MLILEIFQYLLKKKNTHPCNKLISIINLYFCLLQTDNSTETFWESGDEDRNKTKTVTVTCFMKAYPKAIYVHVDNTRDVAVSFSSPFLFTHTNKLHNFQICELDFWSLPFPLPRTFIIDLNCHI